MRAFGALLLASALAFGVAGGVGAADLSRGGALAALASDDAARRLAGIRRLAMVGRMADTERLSAVLADADERNRAEAAAALWEIWGRSGDAGIDALYKRGVAQMNRGEATGALATFDSIVRRKPDFAEGWNKRATVLFFLGRYAESLADCDEVLKRNPLHFGALSGVGQIHSRLENFERALEYFERALAINPNLEGVALNVAGIRRLLEERRRRST